MSFLVTSVSILELYTSNMKKQSASYGLAVMNEKHQQCNQFMLNLSGFCDHTSLDNTCLNLGALR